ncbi:MAG: alanine racemase [Planctomycetes bacterium]|nr:alanine racemase [Planctomycetota bacterium]
MHLPRVWAEIDLARLGRNLIACRGMIPPNCKVLGVVKADAYGHGAVAVSSAMMRRGIAMLGVGDSNEAIRLREAGIAAPILVLGAVVEGEIPELIRHRVIPMIHSPERIQDFNRAALRLGTRMPVHLLVDTGMSRLGVTPARALEHWRSILEASNLELRGVGTHLASPQEDPAFTREQIAVFLRCIDAARAAGIAPPLLHVVSSAALQRCADVHLDMVRLGGFLYGISPEPLPSGIEPMLSLYTQIVYLRDHAPNTSIGYGGTYRTRGHARIATLPVGYHDGYAHHLSNRAHVLIRGERAPVVGRVSMDYVMVDVTRIAGAAIGDRVTLIGKDGGQEIAVADLARWAQTIPYEITCHLGARVRRFAADDEGALRPEEPAAAAAVAAATASTAADVGSLPKS